MMHAAEAIGRIACENVTHEWHGRAGTHTALADVSIDVSRGELVTISGASGAGKTTLLTVIGALTRPTEGRVFLGSTYAWGLPDTELSAMRAGALSFVFQRADLLGSLSVLDNVALSPLLRGASRESAPQLAAEALESLGLGSRVKALPDELSGGERRRAALARAIASQACFVIADEPTGDLDARSAALVRDALGALVERGCGIVVATHDLELAAHGHRRLVLTEGRLTDGSA